MRIKNGALVTRASCGAMALAMLLGSSLVYAQGTCGNVKVAELVVNSNGMAYFRIDVNPLNGANACSSATAKNALAFDSTTAAGKSFLAQISAAFLAGRRIQARGNTTNSCLTVVDGAGTSLQVETLTEFTLQSNS